MATLAVETEHLVRDFGLVRALDSLDLQIEPGQIFGFLGPNGAGKTTTIRLLLDLIRPNSGRARVLGFDCQLESLEVRRRCGYLPGELHLYDGLSGKGFLDFFASLRPGQLDVAYLRRVVEQLDLDLSKRVRAYSKGNRQKLCLVQALMYRPELLILDEPTSGLDPLIQQQVWRILQEVADEGRTVFFSSHVLSEVERICERVGIIRGGKLVAVEKVAELKERSVHVIEVTFDQPVPEDAFALPGVTLLDHNGATIRLQVRGQLDEVVKALARFPVVDLRTEQPGLEDVFLHYYEEPAREEENQHAPA